MKPKQNPSAGVPIMDAEAIRRALRRIAHEIIERNPHLESVVLAGIPSRGVEIARRIAAFIREIEKARVDTGVIDVAMHRDDVGTRTELPVVHASKLPVPLEDRTVIIVDDVLYHRPHRARGDGRDQFVRPSRAHSTRCAGRSRPSRAADSSRLRRKKFADRDARTNSGPPARNRQRTGRGLAVKEEQVTRSAKTDTRWTRKDLLGLRELSADEINFVLETADAFKQVGTREIKKVPALRGKTLVNFLSNRARARAPRFELAAFRLSADVINISATTSSLTKGETLKDTARNLEALHADIIVLRHSSAGAPQFLASRLKASVINAGDGAHEHPTQALLDLYTIRERRGKIAGLHVAIIGDILFSRVARSNIFGLLKLGARVTLVGPSTLVPREFEKLGVEVSHKIEEVLPNADVVNLLRIQHERQRREYFPGPRRIHPLVWPNERTRETFEARLPDHASRPDQPRRRDRQRSRRRIAKRHSRSGHQRSRRAHGRSLFVRRDRDVRALVIARLGSALILSAGDRILRSRTFTSGRQLHTAAKSDKSSSPQDAATSTLQACAPRT